MTAEELQRHQETVAAVLKHMESLTREQWIERLNWRPEGYQEDDEIDTPALQHAIGNGAHPRNASARKEHASQAA
jgi:hypothetical protein